MGSKKFDIVKRDNSVENVSYDKITLRNERLTEDLDISPMDLAELTQSVIQGLTPGIKTEDIDNLSCETAMALAMYNPDFGILASRIFCSNLHKQTPDSFSDVCFQLSSNIDKYTGESTPLINDEYYNFAKNNMDRIEKEIDYSKDFLFSYFALKTLTTKSYLLRIHGVKSKLVERPQHMFMRMALSIHGPFAEKGLVGNIDKAIETYHALANHEFIHATPTILNSGSNTQQLASCFAAGSLVFTTNDGPKKIEEIVVGDKVITHTGKKHSVVQVHKNLLNNRKVYDLECYNSEIIKVTDNHKLLSVIHEDGNFHDLDWISVESLRVGDYIAIPNYSKYHKKFIELDIWSFLDVDEDTFCVKTINENNKNVEYITTNQYSINSRSIKRFFCVDQLFARVLGFWIQNGNYLEDNDGLLFVIDTLNEFDKTNLNFVKSFFEINLGLHCILKNENKHLVIYSDILFQLWTHLFHDNCIPHLMFDWDFGLLEHFIQGLFYSFNPSMGVVSYLDKSDHLHDDTMFQSLSHLFRKFGILTYSSDNSFKMYNSTYHFVYDNYYQTSSNSIDLNCIDHWNNFKIFENRIFVKITKKKLDQNFTNQFVYTLGVHRDHSYTVGGLIAQNCFLFSIPDDLASIFETFKTCALISKQAGGIGLSVKTRGKGSYIKGTNGQSNGIIPMIKCLNAISNYVDQCFPEFTYVTTLSGPKQIQNIVPGDQVLTHDGTYQTVLSVKQDWAEKQKLLGFQTCNVKIPIFCTFSHPLLAVRSEKDTIQDIQGLLLTKKLTPQFIEANKLNKNDWLSTIIPKFEKDINTLTSDICFFQGLCFNRVHTSKNKISEKIIVLNNLSLQHENWIIDFLTNTGIQFHKQQSNYITLTQSFMLPFVLKTSEITALLDQNIIHLPIVKMKQYLLGVLFSIGKLVQTDVWSLEPQTFTHIERDIQYMLLRLGKTAVIQKQDSQLSTSYLIDLSENSVHNDYFTLGDSLYTKIHDIIPVNPLYTGYLYDLNVEKNANYSTELSLVHNGGGKRKGSIAVYLQPFHPDILEFLELRLPNGNEEKRARDIFLAMWMCDLFFERVKAKEVWSLFDPNTCPELYDLYGKEFEERYTILEKEEKFVRQIQAEDVWMAITRSISESGLPYISSKDQVNLKSNHKNIGPIRGSNLCDEIVEYHDDNSIAVCLGSDTDIITRDGTKKIVDCNGQDVLCYFDNDKDLNHKEYFQKAKLKHNGKKQTFKIQITGKKDVVATEDHLFLTKQYSKPFVWKQLKDLTTQDRLYTPSIQAIEGFDIDIRDNLDNDYLSGGWMLGDGWFSKNGWGVCFGPEDTYAAETVLNVLNKWQTSCKIIGFGAEKNVKAYVQPNGVINWQSSKTNFKKILQKKFGFKQSIGPVKDISDVIKQEDPAKIANFLSGLFSSDGCIQSKRNKPSVELSSSSLKLLEDTQCLLHPFGISSRIQYGPVKTRPGRFQGSLRLSGQNAIIFNKSIGFLLCPRKQEKLDLLLKNYVPKKEFNTSGIKSIIPGKIEDVYDLILPEGHNFLANGVVTHNCNLSSIALPKIYNQETKQIDWLQLQKIIGISINNLNNVIDRNWYPHNDAKTNNEMLRPIGMGVQGLADLFALFKISWDSQQATTLNRVLFEAMYYYAVEKSIDLAKETGSYSRYEGSPTSQGLLQYDMWDTQPITNENDQTIDNVVLPKLDWKILKNNLKKYGIKNSLLIALMPTVSTSQILSNSECIEPYNSNIFVRKVASGEFVVINHHLFKELKTIGWWTKDNVNKLLENDGSIQSFTEIPENIRNNYKTIWEISQKRIIDLAADRSPFVDQTTSMNIHLKNPNVKTLTSMLFYGWSKKLKTLVYYTRSKASKEGIKFGLKNNKLIKTNEPPANSEPKYDESEICESCQ